MYCTTQLRRGEAPILPRGYDGRITRPYGAFLLGLKGRHISAQGIALGKRPSLVIEP
jgi:hypothetical protein